jgi:hypothetical protein
MVQVHGPQPNVDNIAWHLRGQQLLIPNIGQGNQILQLLQQQQLLEQQQQSIQQLLRGQHEIREGIQALRNE